MTPTNEQTGKQPNVKRTLIGVVVLVTISMLFMIMMVVMGYLSSRPPQGPPIAVFDIRSGAPFEQHLASSGGTIQVWLDVECDDCSYPIEGNLRLVGDGKTLESVEISAGSSKQGGWEGGKRTMTQRGVFDAKAPAAGVAMTLSGVLTVYGARDYFTRSVKKDAPPPRVQLLRLTVTK